MGVRRRQLPYTREVEESRDQEPGQAGEAPEPAVYECEVCGTQMYGLHCKIICPTCGYRRDCSDP